MAHKYEHGVHTRGGEKKNTSILSRGPNWVKLCNLVQLLILYL